MKFSVLTTMLIITLLSTRLLAASCEIKAATITKVHQWSDGHIFICFDKDSACSCSIKNRMAFDKDEEQFFASMALTAFAAGKTVEATGDDSCSVHGNTAQMKTFSIY